MGWGLPRRGGHRGAMLHPASGAGGAPSSPVDWSPQGPTRTAGQQCGQQLGSRALLESRVGSRAEQSAAGKQSMQRSGRAAVRLPGSPPLIQVAEPAADCKQVKCRCGCVVGCWGGGDGGVDHATSLEGWRCPKP